MSTSIRSQRGSSMLIILMVIATLSACIIASLNFTSVVSRNVERSNSWRQGHEIADGALDYAFAHWRAICRTQTNIQLGSNSFNAINLPPASVFPSVSNFTISRGDNPSSGSPFTIANYQVVATDQYWVPLLNGSQTPPEQKGMSWGTTSYNYLATADVTLPTMSGKSITVKARRIFSKSLLSPWNYAIFYIDDLELHPGAPMDVTGWVHSNGTLYTGHNTLTFQSKVSYGNDWSKNFKPGDGRYGTEAPTSPSWQSNLPPFRDQGQQPFGLDSSQIFSTADGSANNDSYRELVEKPSGSGIDPVAEARYYNQADVKILVNNAGTATYYRKDDTVINASSTGNDLLLYKAFLAATNVGKTITDKREGNSTVRLVEIDVSVLNDKLTSKPGASPPYVAPTFNGVAYVSDQSGSASTKRAVRLVKGATITPPNGLTFATDNGLYIQGDYNTGRTGSLEPPSNTGNAAIPTATGYTRKPCAVLADAVTILSNAWNDTNSSSGLPSRSASPTTVNTAIVSGIVLTTGTSASPGNYSGGAENFPRFLESWNGDTFTYYGSMIELFQSKQFGSPWQNTGNGPNVYDAPIRRWFFDSNFFTKPPPGTLTLVSYTKGRWFTE